MMSDRIPVLNLLGTGIPIQLSPEMWRILTPEGKSVVRRHNEMIKNY